METEGGPEVWLEQFSNRHPLLVVKDIVTNGGTPNTPANIPPGVTGLTAVTTPRKFVTKENTYKDEVKPFNAMKHAHSQMYYRK